MHPCFFSAVTTSRTSFQIASECTIHCPWFLNVLSCSKFWKNIFLLSSECIFYCPCFQHFLIRFNFQKHCSKCARMHLLVFLVSKLSQQCQLWLIGQCLRWWADILSSVNTHLFSTFYSRSYLLDCHTVRSDECLHYCV